MMRGIRRRARQRGQSLTEMALLVPILLGFFALTIQGGVLISDQVNLQHYAYEGAQWAVANRTTATTTSITSHIRDHMCGNSNPLNTSTAVSRYCRDNTLAITVSTANATASRGAAPPFSLIPIDAVAASCRAWDLTIVSPTGTSQGSPVLVAQGSSTNITVSMAATGSGTSPVVNLAMTGNLPGYMSNGTPQFNPPTVADGGSATINIAPSINTPKNTTPPYELKFGGLDQCGGTPSTGTHSVWVQVTDGGGPGTLSLPLDLHLDGVFPLCIPIASPTSLTLNGVGFSAGATVTIGAGASALGATVTSNTSTQLVVTVPAPPTAGVYDATVTNGDGTTYTLANAVTVGNPCPSTMPAPGTVSSASTPCAIGPAGVATEYTVTITWTEKLIIPWITSNVALTAKQKAFCQ